MNVALAVFLSLEFGLMVSDEVAGIFESRITVIQDSEGNSHEFSYRMLKPESYEPGRKYPVVLFLHGKGESGDDNKSQLAYLPEWMAMPANREKYPCFLIAPQFPTGEEWTWEGRSGNEIGSLRVAADVLEKTEMWDLVDPSRIYLTGLSKGGSGVWSLAARMPEQFAAVVPVCGTGDEKNAGSFVDLPIWVWHGDADEVVPVDESRKMIAAIRKAGGNPKYTELLRIGHDESWQKAYNGPENVLPWMFEQVNRRATRKP